LNKDLLWYSNEDEFASNGRDPDSALR
jgi:hypothetical protein